MKIVAVITVSPDAGHFGSMPLAAHLVPNGYTFIDRYTGINDLDSTRIR